MAALFFKTEGLKKVPFNIEDLNKINKMAQNMLYQST